MDPEFSPEPPVAKEKDITEGRRHEKNKPPAGQTIHVSAKTTGES